MRIGVVTDIHSNLPALQAVLEDMGQIDALWCLGDLVGYGPWPNEVISVLRERGVRSIAGNHDLATIDVVTTEEFSPDAAVATAWTATQLSAESRAFLQSLAPRAEVEEVTLAHASPREPVWEYLLSAEAAAASFPCFSTQLCLVGHTHVPSLFVEHGEQELAAAYMAGGKQFSCDARQCIANPGSVGQPRDRDPRAAYLILDTAGPVLEWCRVSYDIAAVQAEMRRVGLPSFLIERLRIGV